MDDKQVNIEVEKNINNKSKRQGPVRVGGLVICLLVFSLIGLYCKFLMDWNIRVLMEYSAEKINKAEVNIGEVVTNVFDGTIEIKSIQVTDRDNPNLNKVFITQMSAMFSWDALMRAKFVFPVVKVQEINFSTKRKSSGLVFKDHDSAMSKTKNAAKGFIKEGSKFGEKAFKGNILGDISGLLNNKDFKKTSNVIIDDLESKKYIDSLEAKLSSNEALWKDKLKSIKSDKEVDNLIGRAKTLSNKRPKKTRDYLRYGKELRNILKDSKNKIKYIKKETSLLKDEINLFKKSFSKIDELVKKDIESIEARLSIPSLKSEDLSNKLFEYYVLDSLGEYRKYYDMIKDYLPKNKKKPEDSSKSTDNSIGNTKVDSSLGNGQTYSFSQKKSYPFVWFKKVLISTGIKDKAGVDYLYGQILNVSSDPINLEKDIKAQINGTLPSINLNELKLSSSTKVEKSNIVTLLNIKANKYSVKKKELIKDDNVTFGIKSATGNLSIKGKILNDNLNLKFNNIFYPVTYMIKTKQNSMKKFLNDVTQDVSKLSLNGSIYGKINNPTTSLYSNLAKAFKKSIKKQLSKKIKKIKQRIRSSVLSTVGGPKSDLIKKYNLTQLSTGKNIDFAENNIIKKLNSASTKAGNNKNKINPVDDIKKKLKKLKLF